MSLRESRATACSRAKLHGSLPEIARAACLAFAPVLAIVACSGGGDISVGRNDPLAPADRPSGASRSPSNWLVPTSICDAASCQLGPDCTLQIGDCVARPGAASAGACAHVPDACADEISPVCGCDGHTYANACLAALAHSGIQKLVACDGDR